MNTIASAAFCASMVVGAYDAQAQGNASDRDDSRVTVIVTGVSHHSDRQSMFREVNPGMMVEVGLGRDHTQNNGKVKTSFVGGAYANSIRSTTYAAGVRGSYAVTSFMDVGLSLGVLTYPQRGPNPHFSHTTYYLDDGSPYTHENMLENAIIITDPADLPEAYTKKGQSGYFGLYTPAASASEQSKNFHDNMKVFIEQDDRARSVGKGIPRFAPVPDISLHHGAFGLRVQGGYIPDTGWVGMAAATLNFGASKNQITKPGKRLCFMPRGRLGGGYKPK